MQRPYPNPDRRLALAAAEAREKKGEAGAGGLDRELAAKVYLRTIVSARAPADYFRDIFLFGFGSFQIGS